MGVTVPWSGSFVIDGDPDGGIDVTQVDHKLFRLRSTVRYVGEQTGLEDEVDAEVLHAIRAVTSEQLPFTDLTSVPAPLRWFVSQYGAHTPAALIHDALIGADPPIEGLTDVQADRYFRYMLEDLGVPLIRRWLMWAAVAYRTRFCSGGLERLGIIVWFSTSLLGMVIALRAFVMADWDVVAAAAMAPLAASALWGRQYGAGLIAAYSAPWLVPPTLFAALGFAVYSTLERLAGWISGPRRRRDTQPVRYETF